MKLSKKIVRALVRRGGVEFSFVDGVFHCSVAGVIAKGTSLKTALSCALYEWEQIELWEDEEAAEVAAETVAAASAPESTATAPANRGALLDTLIAMVRRAGAEMPGRVLRGTFEADLAALLKEHGVEQPAAERRESR
jgi:hypothetical protein